MQIELKNNPEVKAVILAAFPGYRKLKAYVSVFSEYGKSVNSYWDGGSRNEFAIVHLPSRQRKSLPTATHPYFDVVRAGVSDSENTDLAVDARGNVTLKHLPAEFVLVQAGTFCGKAATAHIYVNAANMPKLLPTVVEAA